MFPDLGMCFAFFKHLSKAFAVHEKQHSYVYLIADPLLSNEQYVVGKVNSNAA
jgi:hypothetical protein